MPGTMPYVNFNALSRKETLNYDEPKMVNTIKKGEEVTIKMKNGNVLTGTFEGFWGDDINDGVFVKLNGSIKTINSKDYVEIIGDLQPQINEVLRLAGVKNLSESVYFNDIAYNDWSEEYERLTIILNPSISWLRNKLNDPDSYGFRFLHNVRDNKLYVWDCHQSWMHQQVFDMVNMDWADDGENVVGIFEPKGVSVWEELASDGKAESSKKLAEKLDGKLFKELYPNGYYLKTCC